MRNFITRDFAKNQVVCLVYVNGHVQEETCFVPLGYNDKDSVERYIRRNNVTNGKLVDVISIEKISKLYGMEESKFISLASPVDSRSKETRNYVSKTVVAKCGNMVYMNPDRTISEKKVTFPRTCGKKELASILAAQLPTGAKFITVENVEEVNTLYVLDEKTFIENAYTMKDHFHIDF